jgi:hypothetical protein
VIDPYQLDEFLEKFPNSLGIFSVILSLMHFGSEMMVEAFLDCSRLRIHKATSSIGRL